MIFKERRLPLVIAFVFFGLCCVYLFWDGIIETPGESTSALDLDSDFLAWILIATSGGMALWAAARLTFLRQSLVFGSDEVGCGSGGRTKIARSDIRQLDVDSDGARILRHSSDEPVHIDFSVFADPEGACYTLSEWHRR